MRARQIPDMLTSAAIAENMVAHDLFASICANAEVRRDLTPHLKNWVGVAYVNLCGAVQLAPDHGDLTPYSAFVRRVFIVSSLKPIKHFAHQFSLR